MRIPTLIIYLCLTMAFIILLESVSLAFSGSQDDDSTDGSDSYYNVLDGVDLPTRTRSYPSLTKRWSPTDPVTAPPPGEGWLQSVHDGWLSASSAYFVGTFLPTLMASVFSIPWKILDTEAKSLEPFAQLARPGGGTASETLLLEYHGVHGLLPAIVGLFTGHSSVALTTFLKYCSALLTPLAAEAVRIKLEGACIQDWTQQCTGELQASDTVIRIAQALLALMICAVMAYIIIPHKKDFGVSFDPRSILGISSLAINPYLSTVMCNIPLKRDGKFSVSQAAAALGQRKFEFGSVTYSLGQQEYGIIVSNDGAGNPTQISELSPQGRSGRSVVVGILIEVIGFALFVVGLCVLIIYYRLTDDDSGFERFMDSQSKFGVRFLFTIFGVIIGLGWGAIFNGKNCRYWALLKLLC